MTLSLAWVTSSSVRGLDDDEPLALTALQERGVAVDVVAWDDPLADWASYDRVLVRSAWDYVDRLEEFLAWLARVDRVSDLRNPLPMMRWSTDKHYLAELAEAGVPTTPTTYVEPGDRPALPTGEIVVKPAVGAGSLDAASYGAEQHEPALAHVQRLLTAGRSVLVQPLLASVAADGEWALVFLGGRYSHAAAKRVILPRAGSVEGPFAEEALAEHVAGEEQVAVARAAMDVVEARFGPTTYARVDLVRDDDGRTCVLELELVEPSLFLTQGGPAAAARLAAACLR